MDMQKLLPISGLKHPFQFCTAVPSYFSIGLFPLNGAGEVALC